MGHRTDGLYWSTTPDPCAGLYRFAVSEVGGKLPPRFTVRVPGIVGVPGEYTLEVLLRLSVSKDGTPVFRLECPSLPVVQRQAALDAVAHLGALLGEGYLVGVGKAAFVTVPVVR